MIVAVCLLYRNVIDVGRSNGCISSNVLSTITSRQHCHESHDDVIMRRRRAAVGSSSSSSSPSPTCTVCCSDQLSLLPSAAVSQQRRYAIASSPCRTSVDQRRRYPINLQRATGTGNSFSERHVTSENDDVTRQTEAASVGDATDRVHRRRRRTAFTNEQVIITIPNNITIAVISDKTDLQGI